MARTEQDWIETVRRLLALATSSNLGEAATAAAKAQVLMERHAISMAMVEAAKEAASQGVDAREPITQSILYNRAAMRLQGKTAQGRLPTWILQLVKGLTEVNRCSYYYRSSDDEGIIIGVGTQSNLTKIATLLQWLMGEVDRLFELDKTHRGYSLGRGTGKAYGNAFRLGAASTINARLEQAAAQLRQKMLAGPSRDETLYLDAMRRGDTEMLLSLDREQSEYSLVKVQTALARLDNEGERVDAWMKLHLKLNTGTARNRQGRNAQAFARGRIAGQQANISGPRGQLKG